MSSTGTRKPRGVEERSVDAIIDADKELIQSFKLFTESSNSVAGLTGGSVNNSPLTPAGNYLARGGDSMIGPLALGPPVDFTIEVDTNNTIDIGPLNDNPQYTSNIQLDDLQTDSNTLDIIANAAFDGQLLIVRTFAPTTPYTISQGTVGNSGNIELPDSTDITMGDLETVTFIFDEALVINNNTGGTWRLQSRSDPGTGGGTGTPPWQYGLTLIATTSGNVVLDLDPGSSQGQHFIFSNELTGDVDITFSNTPSDGFSQPYIIEYTLGDDVYNVTFNDNPDVTPIAGTANAKTKLAGYITNNSGVITSTFTMTSTAGTGSGGQNQTPWESDIDANTFDLFNLDRLLFTVDSGSFGSASDTGFLRSSLGLIANVPTDLAYLWNANANTIMSMAQETITSNSLFSVISTIDGSVPKLQTFAQDSTPTINSTIGFLDYYAQNSVASNVIYGSIRTDIEGITSGIEEGSLSLLARSAGNPVTFMSMNDSADGKITAFRNIHMDTGRDIELEGNDIFFDSTLQTSFTGTETGITAKVNEVNMAIFNETALVLQANVDFTTRGVLCTPTTTNFLSDGQIWYSSTLNEFQFRENGVTVGLGSGASQTPWTSNIDADGFNLTDFGRLEYRTGIGDGAGSIAWQAWDGTNLTSNVPTNDIFAWAFNNVDAWTMSATTLTGPNVSASIQLALQDSTSDPTGNGAFRLNGNDIIAFSGGLTRNLSNIPTTNLLISDNTWTGENTWTDIAIFNDNVTIGSSAADVTTINAQVNSDIIPNADNTFSLGANTEEWEFLRLGGGVQLNTIGTGTLAASTGKLILYVRTNGSDRELVVENSLGNRTVLATLPAV